MQVQVDEARGHHVAAHIDDPGAFHRLARDGDDVPVVDSHVANRVQPRLGIEEVLLTWTRISVAQPFQHLDQLPDRWAIILLLRAGVDHRALRVHDEVAPHLVGIRSGLTEPLSLQHHLAVLPPDLRVEPDPPPRESMEPPGTVGDPFLVGDEGEGQVEAVDEVVAQSLGLIEGYEDHIGLEIAEPIPSCVHLHEMRATDQSAGVAQEGDDDGATHPVGESEALATEGGKIKGGCGIAFAGWSRHGVSSRGVRVVGVGPEFGRVRRARRRSTETPPGSR